MVGLIMKVIRYCSFCKSEYEVTYEGTCRVQIMLI